MARHPLYGKTPAELYNKLSQHLVLDRLKRQRITTFQLYADGEIIAAISPSPARHPRMPSPHFRRNKLDKFAIAANKVVRGYPELVDFPKKRVAVGIQSIGKETLNSIAAKAVGRKANSMHYYQ